MHPKFYRNGVDILPTACTDNPVQGDFNDTCLDQECYLNPNQEDISSSLMFSQDEELFPDVSCPRIERSVRILIFGL